MNFSWEVEQEDLYNKILKFTRQHLNQHKPVQTGYWTKAQWKLCAEAGLLGLCIPAHYQGSGLGALSTAKALEAFGRGCDDMGLVFSVSAHLLACARPIAEYGSEEIKKAFLPPFCSGEYIAANAITERDAGSDIFALQMRAVRDGDAYILSGTKTYVSNGPVADIFLVYASTNPAHGYLGITGFIVRRDTHGLTIDEPFHKIGLASTPACQIHLDECHISATHRLGAEGQGAQIFSRSMQWERACLLAGYIGMMERQIEQTLAYARERHQFGKALGKNQAVAHRIVDMKLRFETARLLLYRACWQFDQGENATLNISLAKLAVSEAAIQNGLDALQTNGSQSFNSNISMEKMLCDALPSTIFSGTSEMQRNIIANELGL